MQIRKARICAARAAVVLSLSLASWATAQSYTITDLGTLGGAQSYAYGINETGQVTGYALTSGNLYHAFIDSNGSMRDLGTMGGAQSYALAINATGQVTGQAYTNNNGTFHAFRYANGTMQDLGTTGGGPNSEGCSINDAGEVTGYSDTSGN